MKYKIEVYVIISGFMDFYFYFGLKGILSGNQQKYNDDSDKF